MDNNSRNNVKKTPVKKIVVKEETVTKTRGKIKRNEKEKNTVKRPIRKTKPSPPVVKKSAGRKKRQPVKKTSKKVTIPSIANIKGMTKVEILTLNKKSPSRSAEKTIGDDNSVDGDKAEKWSKCKMKTRKRNAFKEDDEQFRNKTVRRVNTTAGKIKTPISKRMDVEKTSSDNNNSNKDVTMKNQLDEENVRKKTDNKKRQLSTCRVQPVNTNKNKEEPEDRSKLPKNISVANAWKYPLTTEKFYRELSKHIASGGGNDSDESSENESTAVSKTSGDAIKEKDVKKTTAISVDNLKKREKEDTEDREEDSNSSDETFGYSSDESFGLKTRWKDFDKNNNQHRRHVDNDDSDDDDDEEKITSSQKRKTVTGTYVPKALFKGGTANDSDRKTDEEAFCRKQPFKFSGDVNKQNFRTDELGRDGGTFGRNQFYGENNQFVAHADSGKDGNDRRQDWKTTEFKRNDMNSDKGLLFDRGWKKSVDAFGRDDVGQNERGKGRDGKFKPAMYGLNKRQIRRLK